MSNNVFVLYKVANSKDDQDSPLYNAFQMERNRSGGVTLADVKRGCQALNRMHGSDGYHWRVRMDDKPRPGQSVVTFKWWDIKDESSRLPIKENVPLSELSNLFDVSASTNSSSSSSSGDVGKPLIGAARGLGKMIKNAATQIDDVIGNNSPDPNEPRVSVIAFKVLDLFKVNRQYNTVDSSSPIPRRRTRTTPQANAAPIPSARPAPPLRPVPPKPVAAQVVRPVPPPRSAGAAPPVRQVSNISAYSTGSANSTSASLLDFGAAPTPSVTPNLGMGLHHSISTSAFSSESKEEKLQREYQEKAANQNRVWDEVDQRWVVVEPNDSGTVRKGSTAAPPGANHQAPVKQNIKGISLDNVDTAGKSAQVAAAVHARVNDMKESQQKAKQELKEREEQKKIAENEEDEVRKRLEPKVKAWSEEHGQKKKLTALLSSMHTILWEGANWKQVSLGDLLDDKKLRRCYLKATLVVHPDKTRDLDAEKRFLAKRIFDALSQAHAEHEDGKR